MVIKISLFEASTTAELQNFRTAKLQNYLSLVTLKDIPWASGKSVLKLIVFVCLRI
jgi:hypothetical protein